MLMRRKLFGWSSFTNTHYFTMCWNGHIHMSAVGGCGLHVGFISVLVPEDSKSYPTAAGSEYYDDDHHGYPKH